MTTQTVTECESLCDRSAQLEAVVRGAWIDRVSWILAVWQPGARRLSPAEVEAALSGGGEAASLLEVLHLPDDSRLAVPLALVHPEAGAVVRMVRSFAAALARETKSPVVVRASLASFVGESGASSTDDPPRPGILPEEEGGDEEEEAVPLNAARLSAFLRKAEDSMALVRPWRDMGRGSEEWACACADLAKLTSLAVTEATEGSAPASLRPPRALHLGTERREAGAVLAAASLALIPAHYRSHTDQLVCVTNALQFLAAAQGGDLGADDLLPALAHAAEGLSGPLSAAIPPMRAFLAAAAPLDGLGAYALVSLDSALEASCRRLT
jgi:hypothetical protein